MTVPRMLTTFLLVFSWSLWALADQKNDRMGLDESSSTKDTRRARNGLWLGRKWLKGKYSLKEMDRLVKRIALAAGAMPRK